MDFPVAKSPKREITRVAQKVNVVKVLQEVIPSVPQVQDQKSLLVAVIKLNLAVLAHVAKEPTDLDDFGAQIPVDASLAVSNTKAAAEDQQHGIPWLNFSEQKSFTMEQENISYDECCSVLNDRKSVSGLGVRNLVAEHVSETSPVFGDATQNHNIETWTGDLPGLKLLSTLVLENSEHDDEVCSVFSDGACVSGLGIHDLGSEHVLETSVVFGDANKNHNIETGLNWSGPNWSGPKDACNDLDHLCEKDLKTINEFWVDESWIFNSAKYKNHVRHIDNAMSAGTLTLLQSTARNIEYRQFNADVEHVFMELVVLDVRKPLGVHVGVFEAFHGSHACTSVNMPVADQGTQAVRVLGPALLKYRCEYWIKEKFAACVASQNLSSISPSRLIFAIGEATIGSAVATLLELKFSETLKFRSYPCGCSPSPRLDPETTPMSSPRLEDQLMFHPALPPGCNLSHFVSRSFFASTI